jgi:hypothetical protein
MAARMEKITLRHSLFTLGIVIQESCGARGPIVVRSALFAGGSFTSQLLVNTSEDLFGRTIECANISGQIIGSKQIDSLSISGACMRLLLSMYFCVSMVLLF